MVHTSWQKHRIGIVALLAAAAFVAGCAKSATVAKSEPDAPLRFLTVPKLADLVQQGTPVGVIFGKIDGSGTVYRLTTRQQEDLRANGMPASLLSYMEQRYQHAIKVNPELATSDAKWKEIDGYWYGGLPAGWPRDWVVGAPSPGELLR